MGESAQATEWFLQLLGVVPTDAAILQRMGEMCDAEGDKSQAFQYHYDVSILHATPRQLFEIEYRANLILRSGVAFTGPF